MLGDGDPAQHGFTIHGHDVELVYVAHPRSFPGRITIVRKRFRPDMLGVIQIDVPPGSGTAIANFMHVFHNLPGCGPHMPPLSNLSVITEDITVMGVYTASFWGKDGAIQASAPGGPPVPRAAPSSRAARFIQQANQRSFFEVTGDACAGKASIKLYRDQERGSWETCDLRDAVVESNREQDAVSITFSAIDSEGHMGYFAKEIRPLSQGKGNVGNGVSIHQTMTAIHRARLCTSQAIVRVPAPPGQDLDAASGEGRGGGARGPSAGASAQAASAHTPAAEPTDGTMVDDAPDAQAQGAAVDEASSKLRQRPRRTGRETRREEPPCCDRQ